MHHSGYFESGNGWCAQRKKQALDLRGQLHVLEKVITLLLNGLGKRFPLFHITLDGINNKGEAQHRRKIVQDSNRRVYRPLGIRIMEQDANGDEAVADLLAQENSTDGKREDVQVDERKRNNEMVRIRDRADGSQDQYKWQPRRSTGSHILSEKRRQSNPFAKIAHHCEPRISDSEMH